LVVGTAVVAVGCVYVGVHYVSDVIVGAALGAACGAVTWFVAGLPPVTWVLNAVERRFPRRQRRVEAAAPADQRARERVEVPTGVS
jgi:membrane-associated phospholipid phosphatase